VIYNDGFLLRINNENIIYEIQLNDLKTINILCIFEKIGYYTMILVTDEF
jgi:hypothetical protein